MPPFYPMVSTQPIPPFYAGIPPTGMSAPQQLEVFPRDFHAQTLGAFQPSAHDNPPASSWTTASSSPSEPAAVHVGHEVAGSIQHGQHAQENLPFWRPFGQGLMEDVRNKMPFYLSDITDGFALKTITTVLYLFWGCIANAVAWGSFLGEATDGYIGATETLLASAVLGMLYPLLCGQPLTIMGPTGPLCLFMVALKDIAKAAGVKFLPLYAWSGIFLSIYLFLTAMFSLNNIIRKVSRFTEETFSLLISVIFIYSAVEYFVMLFDNKDKTGHGGAKTAFLVGLTVFFVALNLRGFRTSVLFTRSIRNTVADFAPVIAIFWGHVVAW